MAKRLLGGGKAAREAPAPDAPSGAGGGGGASFNLSFNTAPFPGDLSKMYVDVAVQPPAQPPGEQTRRPCDVVCVVDVSGSMSAVASIPDENGESDNLTRLDLVKHSVRTIIAALKPQDRLAVVSFSSDTKIRVKFTHMDKAGQKSATAAVNAMVTEGCTNMWDGIKTGLNLALNADGAGKGGGEAAGRTRSVFLLTDGEPSDDRHMERLAAYIEVTDARAKKGAGGLLEQVTLSTFGFGYSLNSELLDDIAAACGGMYTFVPDASIVGTAFVSSLSNALATMQQGVRIRLACKGEPLSVLGCYPVEGPDSSGATTVHIGSVLYGQTRNVVAVVHWGGEGELSATVLTAGGPTATCNLRAAAEEAEPALAMEQVHRLEFGTALRAPPTTTTQGTGPMGQSSAPVRHPLSRGEMRDKADKLAEAIQASPAKDNANTKALLEDVQGQVKEALSKDEWFRKWGAHYIPSLCRSHMLQQCSNFKDPGLQVYGGAVFQGARAEADDIFVSLPAPTPTGRSHSRSRGGGGGGARAAPVSMARYYNAGGGCFLGSCTVRMAPVPCGGGGGGGAPAAADKLVRDIRKGDRVATAGGGAATVRCVVQTTTSAGGGGAAEMVALPGGLVITPYHPVRDPATGRWAFPADLAATTTVRCDAYYTFVLDVGHTAFISGVECVGLGHGFEEDVVRHAYLGSTRVVDDLARLDGWATGMVTLEQRSYVRDPATMQITGLVAPRRAAAAGLAGAEAADGATGCPTATSVRCSTAARATRTDTRAHALTAVA